MIEVELPDGRVLEFPDGTSRETMRAALNKVPPAKKPEAPKANIDDILPPDNPMERVRAAMGRAPDKALDWLTEMYLGARGEKGAQKGLAANVAEKRRLDAPLMETTSGQAGDFLGDASMAALPVGGAMKAGGAAMKAAPQVFKSALAKLTGNSVAAGVGGAAHEAMKPVEEGGDRGDSALFGFGAGVGGNVAGAGIGRAVGGLVKKARAAGLLPASVADSATLGQLADKDSLSGRTASRLEESLQSVPGVGSVVANARKTASREWRDELVDRVSPSGFKSNKATGTRDAIGEIQDEYGKRYAGALDNTSVTSSPQFENDLLKIVTDPKAGVTESQRNEIFKLTTDYYENLFAQGKTAAGADAKDFERFLTKQRMGNERAVDSATRPQMAAMWDKIEEAWTNAYRGQIPAAGAAIKELDKGYAPFKTVERAATAVGNEFGDFTPSQLLSSVKARTPRPQFGAGEGMLQEDAQAGRAIFGDKLQDSGTVERASSLGMLEPVRMAGAAAAAPLFVSKTGRNAMLGDTRLQKLLQKMRADDIARKGGAPAALGLADQEY